LLIHRHVDGRLRRVPDEVAIEEPLEIRLDGHVVATTLRTPGNDHELAVGLLHSEGLIDGLPITRVHHCFDDRQPTVELNVITVDTGGRAPVPTPRLQTATAACGLCGSTTIAGLTARLQPLPATDVLPDEVVLAVGDRVRGRQGLFGSTGGVHAAAVFDAGGEPLLIREDVGRHNAVDKLVGRLRLDDRLPATGLGLFVSGRAGFELVQKAWAAGFAWMVAVGAPTSLAVRTARTAGLVLVGFATDRRFNLYAPLLP
ncbi:MAG TPA: formate dehydrogenase accessory sulfurtransferase FdhD, partial [Acidimicrobiales bacterium]|nr:formate dehydrogenase accessory sulfurtransferase FdhD [Acidimicrobiales bacterium]